MAEVKTGDAIRVCDENYVDHDGLVTTVHGGGETPTINAVYVSADATKRDPYGQQLERLSSLPHKSLTQGMPRPGRYWDYL